MKRPDPRQPGPRKERRPEGLEKLLTQREAADRLRISYRTLSRWIALGIVRPVRIGVSGRTIRFTEAELQRIVNEGSDKP